MLQSMRPESEVRRLVEDNRRLVEYMVNRYLKRYHIGLMEREDLVSWGLMGLVNAARAWDPQRNVAFSTLACRAIERMIIRGVNRECRPEREGTVSLDELVSRGQTEGGDERFVDHLPAADNVEGDCLEVERGETLHRALRQLPVDQRDLIYRHFLQGEPVRDIAASLGLSRQGLYSREKVILRKLRESLGDSVLLPA